MSESKKKFSELVSELEEIVGWFSKEAVDLDETVKKYESGTKLIAEIEKRIAAAEKTITEVKVKNK